MIARIDEDGDIWIDKGRGFASQSCINDLDYVCGLGCPFVQVWTNPENKKMFVDIECVTGKTMRYEVEQVEEEKPKTERKTDNGDYYK